MIVLPAEILALSPPDRLRYAAQLLEAEREPDLVWLLLEDVVFDLLTRAIHREATWKEATH